MAFEFFAKLGAPYYCFHDRDVAPEGSTPRESVNHLHEMVDVLQAKQAATGMKLLWGTANLFSHRRFMSGAATNPAPEIFALAALQVKAAMDAAGLAPDLAEVTLRADNDIAVGGETAQQVVKLLRWLEDMDDVQNVYSNADLGEDAYA